MCRSFPVGKVAPGIPDLWLEVRPVGAVAAQPKIDASAGDTDGRCAGRDARRHGRDQAGLFRFRRPIEIVNPGEQGRVSVGVPIDMPFTEVNKTDRGGSSRDVPSRRMAAVPADVTVKSATVVPSGRPAAHFATREGAREEELVRPSAPKRWCMSGANRCSIASSRSCG